MTTSDPQAIDQTTTIILVRHGESTWNAAGRWQGQADPPLSDQGREQARLVARRLSSEPISSLYSSDLRRAVETATAIGQSLELEPRLEPRLRELDVGTWAGLTRPQLEEEDPERFHAWRQQREDVRAGGGETFREMQQRAVAAFSDIVAHHPGETVALVAHGGVIHALRAHMLGLAMREMFQGVPPNRNAAVTIIHYRDGKGEIKLLMDASHLDEPSVQTPGEQ